MTSADGDAAHEASRDQWSAAAGSWADDAEAREAGPSGAAADWMLDRLALTEGERVLELACGDGGLGLRAAQQVGPTGFVLCSDFAEPMADIAGARARKLGLSQVEAAVLDAERAAPESEPFDAVLCRFGFMLMSDPAAALRHSRSALKPSGRLALAVWGTASANPWQSLVTDAVMQTLNAPPPGPGSPGPFSLADHDRLRPLLADAGFERITIEDLEFSREHPSIESWWDGLVAGGGPLSAVVHSLPQPKQLAVRELACRGAARYEIGNGAIRLPACVVVATAWAGSA